MIFKRLIFGMVVFFSTSYGSMYIGEPGLYILNNNETAPIIIETHDVTLDLNRNAVYWDGALTPYGIEIKPNSYNIVVKNGLIMSPSNTLQSGIYGEKSAGMCIENVFINGCILRGIGLSQCSQVYINNCCLTNNNYGIYLQETSHSFVENSTIMDGNYGFWQERCSYNFFSNCMVLHLRDEAGQFAIGFSSRLGIGNKVSNCCFQDIQAGHAIGIQYIGPEIRSAISDCTLNSILPSEDLDYETTGISMHYSQWKETGLPVHCMSWSSDGKYLACAGQNPAKLAIYRQAFDQSYNPILEKITDISVTYSDGNGQIIPAQEARGIAWAADGYHLAVAGNGDSVESDKNTYVYCNMYTFTAGTLSLLESLSQFNNHGMNFYGLCNVADSQYFMSVGQRQNSDNNQKAYYQIYTFTGTTFSEGNGGQLPHEESTESSLHTVTSFKTTDNRYYVALGGNIRDNSERQSSLYIYEFANGDINTQHHTRNLFWLSSESYVEQVCLTNDSRLLAAVGKYDKNSGGIRIYEVAIDPDGNISLSNKKNEEDIGSEVRAAGWLPTNRIALGFMNKDEQTPAVRMAEYRGEEGDFKNPIGLVDPLATVTIMLNAVAWSPDYAYLAYGTDDRLGMFVLPSQCSITRNTVTGVQGTHDTGIDDSSGCNIIIQNNAYNNVQNYSANNNSNVVKSDSKTINIAANIAFEQ